MKSRLPTQPTAYGLGGGAPKLELAGYRQCPLRIDAFKEEEGKKCSASSRPRYFFIDAKNGLRASGQDYFGKTPVKLLTDG